LERIDLLAGSILLSDVRDYDPVRWRSHVLVSADPPFLARRDTLVAVANRHAMPAIYGRRDFAAAGGLASYGANLAEPYHLMGSYVARILKGEKPSDLPVAQPRLLFCPLSGRSGIQGHGASISIGRG